MRQWLRRPAPEPGAWLEWGRFLPGVQELQKTELGPSQDAESSSVPAPWLVCSHLEQHPNPPVQPPCPGWTPSTLAEMGFRSHPRLSGQHWVPRQSPALLSLSLCSICRGYERAVKAAARPLIPGTQSQTHSPSSCGPRPAAPRTHSIPALVSSVGDPLPCCQEHPKSAKRPLEAEPGTFHAPIPVESRTWHWYHIAEENRFFQIGRKFIPVPAC